MLTLLAALAPALAARADEVRDKLDAAKEQHAAAVEELGQKLDAALARHAADARAKGDMATAEAFERQRAAFEDGTLPGLLPADSDAYQKGLRAADKKLADAYKKAIEACRSRAQYDDMRALESELELLEEAQSEPLWTGLLDTVQPERDAASGDWKRAGGALEFSGAQGRGLLRVLQAKPPAEYDLELVATRTAGDAELQLGFRCGTGRGLLVIDGFGGRISGISQIDGRDADKNATAHQGAIFGGDAPVTLSLRVRKDGVKVRADGELIVDWTGKPASITLPEGLRKENAAVFFVASPGSSFRLESLRMRAGPPERPAKPAAKLQEPPPAKPPAGSPPPTDPLPEGIWMGQSDTNFNGRGGRGTCTVRVKHEGGSLYSIRLEDDTTSAEWKLLARLNGNTLSITGGDLVRRGNLNVARSGRLAVWLSGSGQVSGKTLSFSFGGKCDGPHKKGMSFYGSARVANK